MSKPTNTIPQNLEMEEAVLGAILQSPKAFEAVEQTGLKESDFYRESHQTIYRAVLSVAERDGKVDELTVSTELERQGHLQRAGGTVGLYTLTQRVPAIANAQAYANEVIEQARRRFLVNVGHQITKLGYEPGSGQARDLINRAAELVAGIEADTEADEWVTLDELLQPIYDQASERYRDGISPGLQTGFTIFDERVGGLHPTELTIVAARPGMGKSAFVTNIAEYVAVELGKDVAIETLEMSAPELASRILSSQARVSGKRVRQTVPRAEDFTPMFEAMQRLRERAPGRIHIGASGSATPFGLRMKCRRLAKRLKRQGRELSLVVVDYLQLVDADGRHDNRTAEVTQISRQLKRLAMELNVPVVAVAQLNRGVELRADKRPLLSDLRESGSLEQDANVVVLLYRDDYYNKQSMEPNVCEVNIAKNRNGSTGVLTLGWEPQFTRFTNIRQRTAA
jgi:replicative DNA helicase